MPVLNLRQITASSACSYPAQFAKPCAGRSSLDLSAAGGLSQFGAKLVTLASGAWASQRHHHSAEDELIYIVSGRPTFIDDEGERELCAGDVTAHPFGDGNGHHMINRTQEDVVFVVIGTKAPQRDHVRYPDVDLDLPANGTVDRVFAEKT